MSLIKKTCEPCRGGIPPLKLNESQTLLAQTQGWKLIENNSKITREFKTKNFREALDFVNSIGHIAEKEGHHPDINFGWGYCQVYLYTHKINGLHQNDFIMAAKINEINNSRSI